LNKVAGALVIILGLMSSYFFYSAGNQLQTSGQNLTQLRSQGGESVAEFYYQEIGRYGIAYSKVSHALALGILSISCGIGGILVLRQDT
jgi:predicted metal-dependent phosphotriesterase family hydrolase